MNEQKLSRRLATVANYIKKNDRVADIGSDHAYLPAWLILNQQIECAIAGEVVMGPYQAALKLVRELSLEEQISVRLGDGLAVLTPKDQVTAITIAGMGGTLISEILERGHQNGQLTGRERLVLQPNIGGKGLRRWLMVNHYQIIAESVIEEEGKFYEVIVAEKVLTAVTYDELELTFGPFLLKEKSSAFKAKWQSEIVAKERVLAHLNEAKVPQLVKMNEVSALIQAIKEVIK